MSNSPPSSEFYRPRLGQAADTGLLLVAKCNMCRRARAYLATDLLQIYHRDTFLDDLFDGRCPRCGRSDFWRVRQRYPSNSDVGMLVVRRLAGTKTTHLWRDELYSAPVRTNIGD
ncbi:MAG: hypothetical protein ABS76_36870 [Pelagibacterium sp. SCN 64-44]|jgi:hypothetical protein|nr:MAG: hypothetical protein ABS76_36870 [Pelagibacterium sp. SCN 64-44]